MDDILGIATKIVIPTLTGVGTFYLGRYQARNRAAHESNVDGHKEREQLFTHYNDLIQATREMNHSLRNELQAVRANVQTQSTEHHKSLAEIRDSHETCRIDNERLKSDLKHLRSDFAAMKEQLAEYRSQKG